MVLRIIYIHPLVHCLFFIYLRNIFAFFLSFAQCISLDLMAEHPFQIL